MLVDIANEQSKKHVVALIVVNALVNPDLAAKVSDRVRLITINRKPGSKRILDVIRLNMRLRALEPDIVHCHNWNLVRLLKFGRFRRVLTVHNARVDAEEAYLNKYDAIFAISDAVQHYIAKKSAAIVPIVVYNGIDFADIGQREKYQFDTFEMVQIGELNCEVKAQDVLLRALHSVVYQYGVGNVHLDLIGDGDSRSYLERIRQELNLSSYCSFLGRQDRNVVYANLGNYHLLIQPSRSEGFGLTIVEGMAAKIPVLVSDIEGPMEIIQNGAHGYYFRVGDSENCARMIVRIISEYSDAGLRDKMDGTYRYARTRFDVQRTATEYALQYSCLCGLDGGSRS